MSALFNQTNIAPNTTNFVTRSEVIQGLSTLAGDLSGVNFSTFFLQPNPVVSSLTVNATGLITGASGLQVNNTISVSTATMRYINPLTGGGVQFAFADNLGNYLPVATGGFYAQGGGTAGNASKIRVTPTDILGLTSANVSQPFAHYIAGTPSPWSLSNISSINGNPPSGGTSFTNLTGANLTTTGVLTSPQIVSVSSINGVPYQAAYSTGWTGGTSVSLPTGVPIVLASLTLPAGYLQPNQTYIYDAPITLTSIPGGGPTGFVCNIGLRLGNNGQINYQVPLTIFATSASLIVSLTGIGQTNAISIGSQTIDIVGIQNSGSTFTATWSAPPSAGGVNVYTIKPLS